MRATEGMFLVMSTFLLTRISMRTSASGSGTGALLGNNFSVHTRLERVFSVESVIHWYM